jgi:hypothetical protein
LTSDLLGTNDYAHLQPQQRDLRLNIKPSTAAVGHVDGGWWPWSTDPAAEFPALITAVASWIGPPQRVAYYPDTWTLAERTMIVGGRAVRVERSHVMRPHTVFLTGPNRKQIRLLVVPPTTPGGVARAVLRSASRWDTVATVAEILASNGVSFDQGSLTKEIS